MFKEEEDYQTFFKILGIVKEKYPFELNSYCLMTNHVHFLVTTGEDEIWKIMKMLLGRYAMEYNHKYQYTGHVFERRYKSILIQDPIYFLEVSRYIHLNPVRAGMVKTPLEYEYSSYAVFLEQKKGCMVNVEAILNTWQQDQIEQYRLYVESKLSFGGNESESENKFENE